MSSRIITALSTLGLLEKYKERFEEQDVDDWVVEDWLQDPSFNELKAIIPTAGHRTKFMRTFKQLSSSTSDSEDCVENSTCVKQPGSIQSKESGKGPEEREVVHQNASSSGENNTSQNTLPPTESSRTGSVQNLEKGKSAAIEETLENSSCGNNFTTITPPTNNNSDLSASLVDKTFELYTTEISEKLKAKLFFPDAQVQSIHDSAMEKVLKLHEIGLVPSEKSLQLKNEVEEKIKKYFQLIQEKNLRKKEVAANEVVEESLQKFTNSIQLQIQNANIDSDDCFDEETIENFIAAAKKSSLQHFFKTLDIESESEKNQHEFQQQQTKLESLIQKLVQDAKTKGQVQRFNSERILRDEVEELLKNYREEVNSQIENKFIPAKQLESILEAANKETLALFQSRSRFSLYKFFKAKLLEQLLLADDEVTKISIRERSKVILEIGKKSAELSKQCRKYMCNFKGIDLEKFTKSYENCRDNIIKEFDNFLQILFFDGNDSEEEYESEDEDEGESQDNDESEDEDGNESQDKDESESEDGNQDEIFPENSEWMEEITQLKKEYTDKLVIELQEIFEELQLQLTFRKKSVLQSISDKESEAIKMYTTAMDNFLLVNEACSDDKLNSSHVSEKSTSASFLTSALDEILQTVELTKCSEKEGENPDDNSDFMNEKFNESLKHFDEKCEKQFQDHKNRCKLQREHQESKARNKLSTIEKFYSNELKKIADSVKTQDEFDKQAEKVKEDARKQLESKMNSNLSPPLKEELVEKLEKSMKESYDETLEYLKMKLEEDKVAIEGALITARKHYNSEMEKHLKSPSFIHPTDLEDFSKNTLDTSIGLCKKTAVLTLGQEQQLRDEMTLCFRKFQDQNYMKVLMKDPAIGIDLGTTYCCVSVYLNGNIKIIPNTQGKNTTPSYVCFSPDGSMCIGEPAKDKAHTDPKNTIFDAKRLIGRKFDDPVVQKDIKLWPFKVVKKSDTIQIKAQGKLYHPEQISSFLLAYLKECAEKYLGVEIKKAVITVPAYFQDGQKEATKHAGELAGLEVLKIINEPTAAAMAYKLEYVDESLRTVLVFDLGGGTFDCALVSISGGNLTVKALDGDTHLGGVDFDNEMVSFCIDSFKAKTGINLKGYTISSDSIYRNVMRIRRMCENKKINLSSTQKETIEADVIVPGRDLSVSITRQQFEEINKKQFDKCLEIVEKVLKDAGLDKGQIDDIVMVGGSTRIPKIQEMLKSFFGGKALNHRVNPDEAVAVGAAMQASLLNAKQGNCLQKIISSINDVTPHSIGIQVLGGSFAIIIPKSSKIPCHEIRPFETAADFQTSVDIMVFEGEKRIAAENHKLGTFELTGIPARKKGIEKVDVSMEIDVNGLLTVTATSKTSKSSAHISVSTQKGRLDKDSIQKLRYLTVEQMKKILKSPR